MAREGKETPNKQKLQNQTKQKYHLSNVQTLQIALTKAAALSRFEQLHKAEVA